MNPKPAALTPVVSFEDVSKVYGKVRAPDARTTPSTPHDTAIKPPAASL